MVRLAAAQRDQGPSCPQEDKEVRSSSLTLVDLPAEVQVHIYSFVGSLPFLFSLCFVCKALNRLVKEELPWLLSDVSLSRCAQVDDAFLEHMLKIYGKTPFRPRHLDLSGCHNVSLDMLNRLLVNSDNLLTLKLAGCFQLLADPRERTERTAKLRSLAWGDRDLFVRSTESEPDDDYDVDALPEHADKLDGGDANDEANGEQPRSEEDCRLLAHRVTVRVLTSRLHTVTTLNLSGCYTVGASVYLEKILAECPNLVDLNIAGWTLRKTPAALLAGCGKLQRLSLANVRPMVATDKQQLKRLADSCPLLRVLDLSGTQPPPVKSFGRYFAFLERVVLVRISALAERDTWPRQKALVIAKSKEPSDPRAAGSPILVVHHTFHVSTPDALRDSLAAAEKLEVDINAPLLIEQRRIELTYRDIELLKKGFVGTLLTQVVYMASPELVQVVLEHGADPNIANALDGQSPLYIALRNFKRITRLMHAIGNLKSHEELVPALPELQRIHDNQRTIIDMLLAHKASVAAIPNEPDSCFSEAVLSDDLDLVRSLIAAGKLKTEDLVRPYSDAGYSILHRAILAKQPWNWLGFCCEVQGRSSSPVTGYPPQVNGSLDVVRFLIEELGAYPFDSEGGDTEYPRRRYRYRLVQKQRLGHTPWERALMYGDGKLVKAIIRRFSPDLAALDYIVKWKGDEIAVNALHYATMHRNEDVVRTLLKLGLADEATAPYPRFTWRCENYSYTTHAQTRADNGHTQEMCPHVAVVRHLWPLGSKHVVDIFKVAKRSGDTYLHAHIADININVLALVLENGVDPNRKNANGDTAAHILMRKGVRRHWRRAGSWYIAEGLTTYDREKLRMLHTYRADLDSVNSKRATPLHMAVNNNDAGTVKLLLGSLGVEPDPLDANGLTPLQLAVSNRQVGLVRLLVAGGADADQRVSAAMARFIVRRRAELAGEEAEWRAREEKGKRGKRKRPSYSDDACVDDGLVVPFAHFLRKTPQKDFVLPATSTSTSTASPARGKKRKKNESESESEERKRTKKREAKKTKKTKKTKKKRKTKGKEKDDEVEAEEGGDDDGDDVAELVGQATMLHAAAETFGRCSGSDKQQKECLEMVEALLGERLNCAVPTKAELERDKKKTSRNKKKKKASRKLTIKGADPNATDAHGNTALHAFAALGLRQVVVALLLSGADVLARNDERRLGLSLLPDDELVALEKNAARLPAGSATRHLLQSLLQHHHGPTHPRT